MIHTFTYFRPARVPSGVTRDVRSELHAQQVIPERVVVRKSLAGVMRWMQRHVVDGHKGDGGYVISGACTDTRKNGGPASFAMLDADKAAPDWDELDEYEGFAHTTDSHTDEKPAWRVVIPFAEPVAHRALTSPFACAYFRNRTQPSFLPNRKPGAPEVQWRVLRGTRKLDAAALVATRGAQEPRGRVGATGRGCAPDLSAITRYVPPAGHDADRHKLVRALGGYLAHRGYSPAEIAEAVTQQIPSSDPHMRAYQARDAAEQVLRGEPTAGWGELEEWCAQWAKPRTLKRLEAAVRDPAEPDGFSHVWSLWWRENATRMLESVREAQGAAKERAVATRVEHGEQNESGTRTCPRTGWPWVLQRNSTYWLHDPDRDTYGAQFAAAELEPRVREAYVGNGLIEAGDPSRLAALKSDGWIQAVDRVTYDYRALTTTYDPAERAVRCAALQRMPDSRAKFHRGIDAWLRALLGEHYDRAAQWIASCSHLDRLAPCLYLVSPPEGGKGLLFNGLARLWGCSSPVPMAEVVSDFNEKQCECPLVYTDEGFPAGLEFTRFRSMVSDHDRRVNRKGLAKVDVEGCTRNAVGANNNGVLRWARHGELTHNDQRAIAERLLVIECTDEGAAEAKRLLEQAPVDAWARGMIAEHALWLAQTVAIVPRGRWCVPPYGGDALIQAVVNDRYALFASAVATALQLGDVGAERMHVWASRRDDRCIYVHAEHLHRQLVAEDPKMRLGDVKDACKSLARPDGGVPVRARLPGAPQAAPRPYAFKLDRDKVLAAAGLSTEV